MKVHIVITNHKTDWILARFARHLMKYNKWTAGSKPMVAADANVFIPYLDWRFTHWKNTPWAAFFTHDEKGNPMKRSAWDHIAPRADLRITMSQKYAAELEKFGPTTNIPPPVEEMFQPGSYPDNAKPIIGVSGVVYKYGRKGEKLVQRLKEHKEWIVRASGKGWPCPTKYYEWSRMPKYYRRLDVFLCTSLIEGGPVTVLEALACGRPVVVPEHVGLIDELPHVAGIWRYEAGNYDSMVTAIEQALDERADPYELHEIVGSRTPEKFATAWRVAVESMLTPNKPIVIGPDESPDWHGKAGVYVVAYGKPAHDCAYHLIRSIHKNSPGIPVQLVTEEKLASYKKILKPGDTIKVIPLSDARARTQKTKIWKYAPKEWKYVLYLDADMLVAKPLNLFFDILQDGWDMVVTLSPPRGPLVHHAQRKKYEEENRYTTGKLGSANLLQIAGGVWAFRRNARTQAFLEGFHKEWRRFQHTDQQSMMRSFWKNPVRMWTLPREFNWFVHHEKPSKKAVIYHFATAARAWGVRHPGRKLWRKYVKSI